jgi:apolipoprotein D and lipocalin family protein
MKIFFLSFLALIFITGCTTVATAPLPTVEKIDLERYAGKWIEIARYENRFEAGCAGATAQYSLEEDYVRVINSCYDNYGKKSGEAIGRAYAVEESNNSKLRVSFFRPFYGDYWVLLLGDHYQYSVIGDPSRQYLWILSRTQELTKADKKTILEFLPTIGYDVSKLYWTPIRP